MRGFFKASPAPLEHRTRLLCAQILILLQAILPHSLAVEHFFLEAHQLDGEEKYTGKRSEIQYSVTFRARREKRVGRCVMYY
jgi:hypothetical protein